MTMELKVAEKQTDNSETKEDKKASEKIDSDSSAMQYASPTSMLLNSVNSIL